MDMSRNSEFSPDSLSNIPLSKDEIETQRITEAWNLRLTPQEVKILKECQHNAVYHRGLPVAGATAATLYYFMKTGKMNRNPIVLCSTSILGFFVGTMSYRSVCMEKLLALPGSTLKERILQASVQQPQVKVEVPLQESGSWFDSMLPPPADSAPHTSPLDFDAHQSNGFDDIPRTQSDLDAHYALDPPLPPISSSFTTYDDLRRSNREQYMQPQNQQSPSPYSRRPEMFPPNPQQQLPPAGDRAKPDAYSDLPVRPRSDDFLR